ncbi:hypothetical protein J5U22_01153 [Saccharolobus shibatae]|uniref:Transposase n=1 Tax=Saccharolobus shibatae TaxID=2286 RepID=A0A8F5GZI7_9CREN|nr:hypothetical protein J5U22_01153 [Saccharolobus shibatae]
MKLSYVTACRIARKRLKILHKTIFNKKRRFNADLKDRLKSVIKKGIKVLFTDKSVIHQDPFRRLGLYDVPVDYPIKKLNILACIPLFNGVPCFISTYSNVNSRVFVEFLLLLRNSDPIVLILDIVHFLVSAKRI